MSENPILGTGLDEQVIKAVNELISLGVRYGLDVLGALILLAIGWIRSSPDGPTRLLPTTPTQDFQCL